MFRFTGVTDTGQLFRKQTGVVRTNCLDCLDRTNLMQSCFARYGLKVRERFVFLVSDIL